MHYGIIAAGEGSRLAQEGAARPKPLIELCGTPMIDRLIGIFTRQEAESISIIVNEQMVEVKDHIEALAKKSPVKINLIVKSTPSSMHSFHELATLMDGKGRFILTTVDTIFTPGDFARYAESFASAPAEVDGMMAMTSYIDDEKPLYIDVDGKDNITAFRDAPWEGVKYISGGIYGLDHKAIDILKDCMRRGISRMRNFQRSLLEAGLHIKGYDFGKILDVDHVDDIIKAENYLKRHE